MLHKKRNFFRDIIIPIPKWAWWDLNPRPTGFFLSSRHQRFHLSIKARCSNHAEPPEDFEHLLQAQSQALRPLPFVLIISYIYFLLFRLFQAKLFLCPATQRALCRWALLRLLAVPPNPPHPLRIS